MSTPLILGPALPIKAREATPPVSGLIALAEHPEIKDPHWQLGYAYRPEVPAKVIRARSLASAHLGANQGNPDWSGIVRTVPVLLTVEDTISAMDFAVEDYPKRAERLLGAYSSLLLEHELWTGEMAALDSLPNRVLAHSDAIDITGSSTFGMQAAVAYLVGALGGAGMTSAMIHAPQHLAIQTPSAWRNEDTEKEFGFVLVSGTGYDGTGPGGTGDNWVYATEMVNVRLGPIEVIPDTFAAAIDKSSNTITYYAQRVGAADFAGPVFACQIT
jgi:hypothetical protein